MSGIKIYQSRPPERGDVVLKGPNMILPLLILILHYDRLEGYDHSASGAEPVRLHD